MDIYLVRHGQTFANVFGLCDSDPSENSRLTALGESQAKEASQKIKNLDYEVVFVSQMFRTHQTANILNIKGKPIIEDKRLNDTLSGFDGDFDSNYHKQLGIIDDKWNARLNNGESFEDEKARLKEFLLELKRKPYSKVLVVTHWDPIAIIKGFAEHLTNEEMRNVKIHNCEITHLKI